MGIINKDEKKKVLNLATLKIFSLITLFWTAIILILGYNAGIWVKNKGHQLTLNQARAFFNLILTTRYWNASHGSVYVPITNETQPNPFLHVPDRDIVDQNGKRLTMVNPAYMTRQLAELAFKRNDITFHITSQKPIRPENKPYPWEVIPLKKFAAKEKGEYFEWGDYLIDGKEFRYMEPLWVEDACLKCHAEQGYKLGDLRGGISVSIPATDILTVINHTILGIEFVFSGIWLLGCLGLYFAYRKIKSDITSRDSLIEKLETALNEIRILRGVIPICAVCKKIRSDSGAWEQLEQYIHEHSEAKFTHGICPDCIKLHYKTSVEKIKEPES